MVYNDSYQYTMNLKGLLFKRKDKGLGEAK